MPEKKNQHYVPKMLLKRFGYGEDNRQIDLLNIASGRLIRGAPVKNQCSRDYFYDQDGVLEGHLSYFEGRYASVIKDAVENERYNPKHFNDLAQFFSVQKTRTYKEVEAMEQAEEKLMKVRLYGKVSEEALRSVRIRPKGLPAVLVRLGLISSLYLLDLKPFLVVNKSPLEFLISDTPVLDTNRYIRKHYPLVSINGMFKAGVQLFMPVGPRHGFLMHDPAVYTLPAPNDPVTIKTAAAVDWLNRLQYLNAYQNIYVPPAMDETYLRELATLERNNEPLAKLERFEMISDGETRIFGGKPKDEYEAPSEGTTREIVITSFKTLPCDIMLPGLAYRANPHKGKAGGGAGPPRDLVYEEMIQEFIELLDNGQSHFGQFRDFMMNHPFQKRLGSWFERADKRYLFP